MKKYLIFITVTFFVISLSLSSLAVSMSSPDDTFVYATYGPPETLDPARVSGSQDEILIRNIYDTLVSLGPQGNVKILPNLAKSWEVAENGTQFTFHLRSGVKFHNGSAFTAEDVIYSLTRAVEAGRPPARYLSNAYVNKNSLEKIDSHTVRINTEEPSPMLLETLAYPGTSIIDKEWAKKHDDNGLEGKLSPYVSNHANGTGAYKLSQWVKRDHLKLVSYEDYWKGWEGKHVNTVVFSITPEYSTRLMEFLSGKIDYAYISKEHLSDVRGKEGIVVDSSGLGDYVLYIWLNTKKDFLKNKKVRQALNYSFPYEQVIKTAYKDTAVKSTGIASNIVRDYPEGIEWYKQDMEKAKELLKKAGYEDGFPETLTFYYDTGRSSRRKIGLIWKQELKKLGIDINIQSRDWPVMADKVDQGNFELYASGDWTSVPTASGYTDQLESRNLGVSGNFAWIENNTFDVLNQKARNTFETEERAKIYRELHGVLYDVAPIISVVQMKDIQVYGKWVKNVKYYPWGFINFHDIFKES